MMLLQEGELFDVILIANEVVDDRGDTLLDEPDQSKLWTTWGRIFSKFSKHEHNLLT